MKLCKRIYLNYRKGTALSDEIRDKMLGRAGLGYEWVEEFGKPDPDFYEILKGMSLIHRGKEVLYGEYMQTHGGDPTKFALMEHFADVKRKYVRAENFLKMTLNDKEIDIWELFDTYCDMAVYAAMGVQLVLHITEREKDEQARWFDTIVK